MDPRTVCKWTYVIHAKVVEGASNLDLLCGGEECSGELLSFAQRTVNDAESG